MTELLNGEKEFMNHICYRCPAWHYCEADPRYLEKCMEIKTPAPAQAQSVTPES